MEKRTKVCFVAHWAWALFEPRAKIVFGGSEVQLYQLAKELAQDKRFEVSFIVGDFGQVLKPSYEGIKVIKGVSSILPNTDIPLSLNIKYVRAIPSILRLWKTLRKAGADIYIQRAAGSETGVIALFTRLFRKRFIYMVAHEIDVSGEYTQKNALPGKLFDWGIRLADLVIVQNQQQNKLLQKNLRRNGLLIKSAYHLETTAMSQKDFVLWVGRCQPWKKPELFLELARVFPNELFKMVCNASAGENVLFNRIKNAAWEIPNLEFIEYIPFSQIDPYFMSAQVLVNTSDYEGFPNTFVQAAKNKTPILSYKVNPDDFINQYQCGYCADGDFPKMVVQLENLLYDQNTWNRMSGNAFKYAAENHDIQKIILHFKNLLLSSKS